MPRNKGKDYEPCKPCSRYDMDSRTDETARVSPSISECQWRRMAEWSPATLPANLSREEPDAGNLHVRVCEGRGWQHPRLLGHGPSHTLQGCGVNITTPSREAPSMGFASRPGKNS